MKHQYFGDINDYRKYGLLRLLAKEGGLCLGVCWMLTPDDGRADGGKISYIAEPERWRTLDPELYDHLAAALLGNLPRRLTSVETGNLIPEARFHSDLLHDGACARAEYMRTMLERFKGVDLVFFDPDNGMGVKSCPIGRKGSSKFLAYEESAATFRTGASLLIYQHFGRVERGAYVREQVQRLEDCIGTAEIVALSTSNVLFLLVLHPEHVSAVERSLELLASRWPRQFWLADNASSNLPAPS